MRLALCGVVVAASLLVARPAFAYSVLAHQSMVDALWDGPLVSSIRNRFPQTTQEQLRRARAFAYGGSVIQDLGYYPFGSHQFTDLVHYVRSGDFVEALLRSSRDASEYAFALGALAHYASDNVGHPLAVNRAVPLIYPKTRAKFGTEVTYDQDPRRHIMVEFAFDVIQAARGTYLPDRYRDLIGFEVAKPLLERAFRDTYGLELNDLFLDTDLAIGTYRYAISSLIPEITRVAWKTKQDEILQAMPATRRDAFVYRLTRQDYEKAFGTSYRQPGLLTRLLASVIRIVPKIGPLSPLAFKAPTLEAERLFAESFNAARNRYRALVEDSRDGRVTLANTDFDTGRPARWGEYPRADDTYVKLLEALAERSFQSVPPDLRRHIVVYFARFDRLPAKDRDEIRRRDEARLYLKSLNGAGAE